MILPISDLLGILLSVLVDIFLVWMVYLAWKNPKKLEKIILSFLELDQETLSRRINIFAVFGPLAWICSLGATILAIRVSIFGPY